MASSSPLSTVTSRHHLPPIPGTIPLPPREPPRRLLLQRRPPPRATSCSAEKEEASLTDRILDYIEGGPKLRKWYGAPEMMLPKDADPEGGEDGDQEAEEVRDAVLVTNGDSEIGQMVILSLIVKRARVKALVKDKQAAVEAFGSYVEPIVGDASSKSFLKKAFRGVCAIICPSNEGFLSDVGQMKGVEHIVLLSQGVAATGRLSKEDAAFICVEALDAIPQKGLVFEVASGEEKVSNWKEWFASLNKRQEKS